MNKLWLKDLCLLISTITFAMLSMTLLLKNLLAGWLLQGDWITAPGSVLSVENVRAIKADNPPRYLRLSPGSHNKTPAFEKDLLEFPIPIAFEAPLTYKDKIPLDTHLQKPNQANIDLYFVRINLEGAMLLSARRRTINYDTSPVVETLQALMNGPSPEELSKNYLSFIPPEVKVLSFTLANGTAVLDMNEAFKYSTLGSEGLLNQVKQIVYTLTQFPDVTQVQFLLEGKNTDFLGEDGPFIGKALSRRDL